MEGPKIGILVQDRIETASMFAARIEDYCGEVLKRYRTTQQFFSFTTASDGRQTVNIVFTPEVIKRVEGAMFDREDLTITYNEFFDGFYSENKPTIEDFYKFLLKKTK